MVPAVFPFARVRVAVIHRRLLISALVCGGIAPQIGFPMSHFTHEEKVSLLKMSDPRPLMQRLKEDTRMSHDAAEAQGFMTDLMAGTLPRSVYASALEPLRRVRGALEAALQAEKDANNPLVAPVFQDYHHMATSYEQDRIFFGASSEVCAPQAVENFEKAIAEIRSENPALLLGMFYVLEGSNLGAQVIKKRIKEVYQLADGQGTASMDVHGPLLMPRWREFAAGMDQLPFTEEHKVRLVEVATRTFQLIGELYGEVYQNGSAAQAS
jgi:heme oxygenase